MVVRPCSRGRDLYAYRVAPGGAGAAIIGVINGIVVNVLVTAISAAAKMLGGTGDPSKGLIGALLLLVAFVGGFVALRYQVAGGVMLLIAGIGFFFIVHWWALLVSPSWLVGGALAIAENYDEAQRRIEGVNSRLTPQAASPALPAATAPLIERSTSEASGETSPVQAIGEASAPERPVSAETVEEQGPEDTADEAMTTDPAPAGIEPAPMETPTEAAASSQPPADEPTPPTSQG